MAAVRGTIFAVSKDNTGSVLQLTQGKIEVGIINKLDENNIEEITSHTLQQQGIDRNIISNTGGKSYLEVNYGDPPKTIGVQTTGEISPNGVIHNTGIIETAKKQIQIQTGTGLNQSNCSDGYEKINYKCIENNLYKEGFKIYAYGENEDKPNSGLIIYDYLMNKLNLDKCNKNTEQNKLDISLNNNFAIEIGVQGEYLETGTGYLFSLFKNNGNNISLNKDLKGNNLTLSFDTNSTIKISSGSLQSVTNIVYPVIVKINNNNINLNILRTNISTGSTYSATSKFDELIIGSDKKCEPIGNNKIKYIKIYKQ